MKQALALAKRRQHGTGCQLLLQACSELGKAYPPPCCPFARVRNQQYLAELRGLHKGSGVPFKSLFVSCLRQVGSS